MKDEKFKKLPHNVDELERFQLYEQVRSFTKQLDIVRRGSMLSNGMVFVSLGVAFLLLTNDMTSLIGESDGSRYTSHLVLKIACSIITLFGIIYLLFKVRMNSHQVNDQVHHEKKQTRKVFKRNLQTFQSRIVSHVRASPTDFAIILSNPLYYKNFKFDLCNIKKGDQTDRKEQERLQKRQQEQNKYYESLAAVNLDQIDLQFNRSPSTIKDDSMNVTRDNIKFSMVYDRQNTRFLVEEASYEMKKYFILEYDEERAENGIGNHLQVTQYTTIIPN